MIVASATMLAWSAGVQAQAQIGAVVGATFTTLRGVDNLDTRTGLIGGLSMVLPGGGLFSLQPELLFTSKGAKGTNNGPDGLKLSYVEVPLLLRLSPAGSLPVQPHAYAGPYLGLQINCTVQGTDGDCDDLPGLTTKSVDIGGIAGGGVTVELGRLLLTGGARYSFGVSKVADFEVATARESAKNGAFALYAGLGFRLGGR